MPEKPKDRPRDIVVSVAADGRYAVDRKPVDGRSVETLAAELGAAAAGDNDRAVIISADATTAHQSVINVLDAARRAGLGRITFRDADPHGRRAALRPGGPNADGPGTNRFVQRLQRAWLRRGVLAAALLPLSAVFAAVAWGGRAVYRFGWKSSVSLPVPVVVVGNLIVGGAGKTPTVIAIVALLRRHGYAPGIVSRGYGRADDDRVLNVDAGSDASEVGDEPLLLRMRTGVPVCVGRDRVAAARELLRRHPSVDVIVSDDGLQHRRLARDVQVLVFDDRGAGNGWLLPAGPLREPLPKTLPPRSLVLYNAAAPTTRLPGSMGRRSLAGVVALADWRGGRGETALPIEHLRGRPLVAAAGLAHPQRFFDMLAAAGLTFDALPLADHHDYAVLPWAASTPDVVTTEKDAVKLDPARLGTTRVWVVRLDFAPTAEFDAALLELLRSAPCRDGRAPAFSGPAHGNPPP